MDGGGFVQGGFVRKWLMSKGSYVWRGFCPEGVLSAHRQVIGHVNLVLENEDGAHAGRKSMFSMLKYSCLCCFWL